MQRGGVQRGGRQEHSRDDVLGHIACQLQEAKDVVVVVEKWQRR